MSSLTDDAHSSLFCWIIDVWYELPRSSIFLNYEQSLSWLQALVAHLLFLDDLSVIGTWTSRLELAVFDDSLADSVLEIAFEGCLRKDPLALQLALIFSTVVVARLNDEATKLLCSFAQSSALHNIIEYLIDSEARDWVLRLDSNLQARVMHLARRLLDMIESAETTALSQNLKNSCKLRNLLVLLLDRWNTLFEQCLNDVR